MSPPCSFPWVCTGNKVDYFPIFMTQWSGIKGKRKYWRWLHQTIWALTRGRKKQYCHAFSSGCQLIDLINILNSPICRSSRAGCRGIRLAVGTSGATLGTRPAISMPPSRATSWPRLPDWWRGSRTFQCSDLQILSEIIRKFFLSCAVTELSCDTHHLANWDKLITGWPMCRP